MKCNNYCFYALNKLFKLSTLAVLFWLGTKIIANSAGLKSGDELVV